MKKSKDKAIQYEKSILIQLNKKIKKNRIFSKNSIVKIYWIKKHLQPAETGEFLYNIPNLFFKSP